MSFFPALGALAATQVAEAQNALDGAEGIDQSLRLLDLPASWIVVLVILPLFAAVTWVGYARERIGTGMRVTLSLLRLAAFGLLFLVLARPVLVDRREEVESAKVLVLIDDSASMQRKDAYASDPRVSGEIRSTLEIDPSTSTRLELAQRAYDSTLHPLLDDGKYESLLFRFAESAESLSESGEMRGRGPATHVGDAIIQVLAAHRGDPVTDVLVLSDGRSNGGQSVLEAARTAGASGIPVHTVVIGDTRPEKNAIIELVETPSDALEGDELAVTVRVRGRGVHDAEEVRVVLEEMDDDMGGLPLAEETVVLSEAGERVVLLAPAGLRTGERRFRVEVTPLEGETMIDDNHAEFSVHVSPAHVRVLYVEGYPRWEYRYLYPLLRRADQLIDFQCYLLSATPDFPQESSPGMTPLTRIPSTRQELLDNYDVVILGDVAPYSVSADPTRCEAFFSALREFVEAGGGLLFQAGEYSNPRFFHNTPLEDLLPVLVDPVLSFEGDTRREFRPQLVQPTDPHEMLRLHDDIETNRRLWEDENGLSGFFWYYPVKRAKPGTQTLLEHPSDRNPQTAEAYPLLVLGRFPAGRTMFLAIDSLWRWRYHFGTRYYEKFWRKALRWLALGRLKSGDRRYRLETTRGSYDLEERVQFEARVLNEDFRPSERPEQTILWSGPDERPQELELTRSEDRPGVYRGTLQVERPGLYRSWIEVSGQRVSSTEFEVRLPSRENADPSPDPQAMALLSARTGGRAVELARVDDLIAEFPGGEERRRPISSSLQDAWDNWTTLLAALGILSLEWILRKRVELI